MPVAGHTTDDALPARLRPCSEVRADAARRDRIRDDVLRAHARVARNVSRARR